MRWININKNHAIAVKVKSGADCGRRHVQLRAGSAVLRADPAVWGPRRVSSTMCLTSWRSGHAPGWNLRGQFASPLTLLMMVGIKKENTNSAMEKTTLKEINSAQFPDAQTALSVPIKKVKMKVPTTMPRAVPAI